MIAIPATSTTQAISDIVQRGLMFQPQPMQERLESHSARDWRRHEVGANRFEQAYVGVCLQADAIKDAEIWPGAHPFHKLADIDIVTRYNRAGTPEMSA
jgi:hypothetical protein